MDINIEELCTTHLRAAVPHHPAPGHVEGGGHGAEEADLQSGPRHPPHLRHHNLRRRGCQQGIGMKLNERVRPIFRLRLIQHFASFSYFLFSDLGTLEMFCCFSLL